jgi:hypothetical protein
MKATYKKQKFLTKKLKVVIDVKNSLGNQIANKDVSAIHLVQVIKIG